MNKKGMAKMWWIILGGILALVVFFAMTGTFGWSFKKVFDFWGEFLGFIEESLEGLKGVPGLTKRDVAKKTEWQSIIDKNCDLLKKAADFVKTGDYDKAIEKYIEYSKVYNQEFKNIDGVVIPVTCGVTTPEQIKFRILNAFKDKYFTLIIGKKVNYDNTPDYDELESIHNNKVDNVEFGMSALLTFSYAYLKNKDISRASIFIARYDKSKKRFGSKIENEYFDIALLYKDIIQNPSPKKCFSIKQKLKNFKDNINGQPYLAAFETSEHPSKKDLTDFTASDYKFISIPEQDIEELCKTS